MHYGGRLGDQAKTIPDKLSGIMRVQILLAKKTVKAADKFKGISA